MNKKLLSIIAISLLIGAGLFAYNQTGNNISLLGASIFQKYQGGTGISSTSKGDLLVGNTSTYAYGKLPVGVDGTCLVSSAGSANGIEWSSCGGTSTGLTAGNFSSLAPIDIATTTTSVQYSMEEATASNDGYLSSGDWSTFDSKIGVEADPDWNSEKQDYLTIATATATYLTSATASSTYYRITNPSNYIALTNLSSTATGLTYTNTTGAFSLTSGYNIPLTASTSNWNTAYGWGNHAGLYPTFGYASSSYYLATNPAGYISSYSETDPIWTSASSSYLTINSANATYPTFGYASSTFPSFTYASSTYLAETSSTIKTLIDGTTASTTPRDVDKFVFSGSSLLNHLTWANIKSSLKTYFDTLYQPLNSILTSIAGRSYTKGDLIVATSSTQVGNLAVGTNGYFLRASSSAPFGIDWSAVSGGSYTATGTLLNLTGSEFKVNEGTLTNDKFCKYITGTGLVCNSDGGSADISSSTVGVVINDSTATTSPADTDRFAFSASSLVRHITWANIKATMKTFMQTLNILGSHSKTLTIASTTWSVVGTTTIPAGFAIDNETWNTIGCYTDTAQVLVGFGDGTNFMYYTATTTPYQVVQSTNNTFTATEKQYITLSAFSGTPNYLTCTIKKKYDN